MMIGNKIILEGNVMKKVKFLVFLLAALLILAACAPAAAPPPAEEAPPAAPDEPAEPAEEPEQEPEAEEEQVFRIGVSMPPILNDFHAVMYREIQDAIAAAPANFEFEVVGSVDANEQVNVLEVFYDQGFDGVVISPFDGNLVAPIAEQIYQSGTPTVIINRMIDTDQFRAFVAGDNPGGGRNAADFIGEYLDGEGYVFVMEMNSGTPISNDRSGAFLEQVEAHWPDLTIIGTADSGNTREGGFEQMTNALSAHPRIDAVFGHCEMAGLGMVAAIEAAGRTDIQLTTAFGGSVFIVEEFDNDPDFLLRASMSYLPVMGASAIQAIMDILMGVDVPRYAIDPPLVLTAANLEEWRGWAF